MSRVQKSKRNALFSVVSTMSSTVLTFATRTIFIHTLGLNYLGLNGLFTNVLSFLAIAELGIGNAISFSLYRPLVRREKDKIASYLNVFRVCYRIIGVAIVFLGLCLVPFLDVIVNFESTVTINYVAIYLMFLANTTLPYFVFSYKNVLLYADQKAYIVNKVELICNATMLVTQFLILLFLKNYYVYLGSLMFFSTIKNFCLAKIVEKQYPEVHNRKIKDLTREEKKLLWKNVYSLSLTKISGVVYSSTDNIIISTFINTVTVGLYSNYSMIVNMVKALIASLFNALTASVGNLNAEDDKENLYLVFKKLNFINFWIYGYLFLCLNNLFNIFIEFWVGDYALFNENIVLLISIMFLIPGLNNVINIYKDACGLYWQTKYRALATAVVNLVVSLVLVRYMDIAGVFIGTIVAYLTTIYLKDPQVVFSECFGRSSKSYYKTLAVRVVLLCFLNYLCKMVVVFLGNFFSGIFLFVFAAVVLTLFINGIFVLFYHKNEEFSYFRELLKQMLRKGN